MKETNIVDNIKTAISLLEDNEEYYQTLVGENGLISMADRKIDYWLHFIEFENINLKELWRIYKEIKRLRVERRQYKNAAEVARIFKENEQKMCNLANRKFLLIHICKTENKQRNATYSYNAYTEEERDEILGRSPMKKESE